MTTSNKPVILFTRRPNERHLLVHERIKQLEEKFEIIWSDGEQEFLDKIPKANGIVCTMKVDESILEKSNGLKIIGNFGAGYDKVDVNACTKRKIVRIF